MHHRLLAAFTADERFRVAFEHIGEVRIARAASSNAFSVCDRSWSTAESGPVKAAVPVKVLSACFSTGVAASVSVPRDFCACPRALRAAVSALALVSVSFAPPARGATWPSTSRTSFWASSSVTRKVSSALEATSAVPASLGPSDPTWLSAWQQLPGVGHDVIQRHERLLEFRRIQQGVDAFEYRQDFVEDGLEGEFLQLGHGLLEGGFQLVHIGGDGRQLGQRRVQPQQPDGGVRVEIERHIEQAGHKLCMRKDARPSG